MVHVTVPLLLGSVQTERSFLGSSGTALQEGGTHMMLTHLKIVEAAQ